MKFVEKNHLIKQRRSKFVFSRNKKLKKKEQQSQMGEQTSQTDQNYKGAGQAFRPPPQLSPSLLISPNGAACSFAPLNGRLGPETPENM